MDRNGVSSVKLLARRYRPDYLYGFDPSPLLVEGEREVWKAKVTLARKAAWLHDGTVSFWEDGTGSKVDAGGHQVPCFDFAAWLIDLTADRIIVKMDIEGAEVPLIERMIELGADQLVEEMWVEWHGAGEHLEDVLACPVQRWWL